MKKSRKLLVAVCLSPLLFIGCGGETSTSETSLLNSQNYVKVAKSVYAQQNGENSAIAIASTIPPGATADADTLYIKKVIKPGNFKVTNLAFEQDGSVVTVDVDIEYKYATVTLSGSTSQREVVNMKDFTSLK